MLTHDEFLPSSTDTTLTIKSNAKTYRFRVSADARTTDVEKSFRELTAAIAKLR